MAANILDALGDTHIEKEQELEIRSALAAAFGGRSTRDFYEFRADALYLAGVDTVSVMWYGEGLTYSSLRNRRARPPYRYSSTLCLHIQNTRSEPNQS